MVESNITDRKFTFCPTLSQYTLDHLIVQCQNCTRFYAACCSHGSFGGDWYDEAEMCHHHQLVFVDGACSGNGQVNARAGVGITVGDDDELSWSISVDENMDPLALRTNQRAELLAAIKGLKKLHQLNIEDGDHRGSRSHSMGLTYIVVTDSKYVVNGITEWFPTWKRRNWLTSAGKQPSNLDLFIKLDEYTTKLEKEGVAVGFWHVLRTYNRKADILAKRAVGV